MRAATGGRSALTGIGGLPRDGLHARACRSPALTLLQAVGDVPNATTGRLLDGRAWDEMPKAAVEPRATAEHERNSPWQVTSLETYEKR